MRFLLCGAFLVLGAFSYAEGAKVLGFTMDAPAPDGAELVDKGGEYATHRLTHRLCMDLAAVSDNLGVFVVKCAPSLGVDWSALLRGKYGTPTVDHGEHEFWAVDGFSFIMNSSLGAAWWAPRSEWALGADSDKDDVLAVLDDSLGKLEDAATAIAAAANADVIAKEDF